jgi:hypothetical protein
MNNLRKNLSNSIGWRTNLKIVVFESDDWGSIRTRSKSDYDAMLSKGLEVDRSNFTANDCLESNDDLENLYDLLSKHKDSTGRPPVFTPMCIMANPDFEKIKDSGYQAYYYENFIDTCKRYPNHDKVFNLWRKGIDERLFIPGFHGREHLNVQRWIRALQSGDEDLLTAFEHQSFGLTRNKGKQIPEYLGAFHPDYPSDIPEFVKVIETGAELFNANCGYRPTHFIAPNKESSKALDSTLYGVGVKYLTMSKLRHYPLGNEKFKWEFNWLGKKNELGQVIITRNCGFEPSDQNHNDSVEVCLKDIENAFSWHKPAIISSHRVNYIGSINPENARHGLKELDLLLSTIIKRWPDVEFMTSIELGDLIALSRE